VVHIHEFTCDFTFLLVGNGGALAGVRDLDEMLENAGSRTDPLSVDRSLQQEHVL